MKRTDQRGDSFGRHLLLFDVGGRSSPGVRVELLDRLAVAAEHEIPRVVVDFADAKWIDSGALDVLVKAARRMRRRDARLHLACPNPTIRRVLKMTLLDQLLHVHPSLPAALAASRF